MNKYLKEIIVCPLCKRELVWHIYADNETHIIEAEITCPHCNKEYFIQDRVACFVPDYINKNDNWQQGDDYLETYFKENPNTKIELLNTPVDLLNAADLYTRSRILKKQGNEDEARKLALLGYEKAYTLESRNASESQLNYVTEQFAKTAGFVLDIASGTGRLVDELKVKTSMDIVATDISYNVLVKSQAKLAENELKRISFIAFDANFIPFRSNSIESITSNFGLQNIFNPTGIFNELRHICKGTFLAICSLCPENDLQNKEFLEKYQLDRLWIKNRLQAEFENSGWNVRFENSIIARVKPTPIGEIVKGVGIDGFPISETVFEYCTAEMK